MTAAYVGGSFGARSLTAWEQTHAAQASRHAMAQRFLSEGAFINQSFASAQSSQIDGTVKLIATALLDRTDAADIDVATLIGLLEAARAVIDVSAAREQTAVSMLDIRV
jgi:hypothetical protein